jgi:hypothetical protein
MYAKLDSKKPPPAFPHPHALRFTTLRLTSRNNQLRHFIRSIKNLPLIRNLTRGTAITRRDIERRILGKEIPRSKQQRHGFCRHDGKVLRRWEMRDAECMPEDNIRILNRGLAIGDPFRDAA